MKLRTVLKALIISLLAIAFVDWLAFQSGESHLRDGYCVGDAGHAEHYNLYFRYDLDAREYSAWEAVRYVEDGNRKRMLFNRETLETTHVESESGLNSMADRLRARPFFSDSIVIEDLVEGCIVEEFFLGRSPDKWHLLNFRTNDISVYSELPAMQAAMKSHGLPIDSIQNMSSPYALMRPLVVRVAYILIPIVVVVMTLARPTFRAGPAEE